MGILKSIGDFFRSSDISNKSHVDRYSILTPLMSAIDYTDSTKTYLNLVLKEGILTSTFTGKVKPTSPLVQKGVDTYRLYVRSLPPQEQAMEKSSPLSTISSGLDTIHRNLELIEDNYQVLFSSVMDSSNEESVRLSSLIVAGYIETAEMFCTWTTRLLAHVNPLDHDNISPFWTKEIQAQAQSCGEFVGRNLNKWSPRYKGFLEEIKQMQKRGVDVTVKTGDTWIDDIIHDNQLTISEQDLAVAGLRGGSMMLNTGRLQRYQDKLQALDGRKDWLIAKIALEEGRMRGMDPNSPEYRRMSKAVDHYAALISKYEQKIERMRA